MSARVPLLAALTAAALLTALSGCSLSPGLSGDSSTPAPAGSSAAAGESPTAGSAASGSGTSSSKTFDACTLITADQVSALTGQTFAAGVSSTIATGQDQCSFATDAGSLTVIVYQSGDGVTWTMMTDVLSNTGDPVAVSGIGDKAMEAGIEVDAQVGTRLLAVQGASLDLSTTEAVAKAVATAMAQ